MKLNVANTLAMASLALILGSCATAPKGMATMGQFDKSRYLGKWYEVARFDFSFEKNLDNTTAEYSLRSDGKIAVKNRGYNYVAKKWQEANGKARFKGPDTVAQLEVSFFGPFYGAYNVVALDKDYQYALIAGSSLKYLWILSRTPTLPDAVKADYLNKAKAMGYDVGKLIWVKHNGG
jgi:apolipoprotein D and lipocalin family protein